MKRQSTSLIFMALLGACTATTTDAYEDTKLKLNTVDDASINLDSVVISDETDLTPADDTLTETGSLDEDSVDNIVLQTTGSQTTLSSAPAYDRYFNADPSDRNLGSSGDDIKLLSGRAYQMYDEVNGYTPELSSVIKGTKLNSRGVFKQYKSAADQAEQLGDIGSKVHQDSYDIKKLENQFRTENEAVGRMRNNLISLKQQSELNDNGNDQAVNLLKELNSQIVIELTKSQQQVDDITNNLKIVNNRQITLNSSIGDNTNDESKRLEKLKHDLEEMQQAITHNQELANSNNTKLSNYKTTVGDIDSNVSELTSALRGPILQKFQELQQDEAQLTDSVVKIQTNYNDYRNQTGNQLKDARKKNEEIYNAYESQFNEYGDLLQQQSATNESLQTKLQNQMKISASRDQDSSVKINDRIQRQFDNSEAVLGNYYNNFNDDKETINGNISLLLKNLTKLGEVYTSTKENNFDQLGEVEQLNNQNQIKFKQQISDLQAELTNLQSGWDANVDSKFSLLTENQQKEQQEYAEEQQLLKRYQSKMQQQDEEILNLKKNVGRGKKAMSEEINTQFTDYQGKITDLQSQLEKRSEDHKGKITSLQGKQTTFMADSKKHDDMLRRWIQGTHDQLTELSNSYNLQMSKLKESVQDNKILRGQNKELTDKQIKNYLKSMRSEQSNTDSKKQQKLQKAAEDRENQELSLRAEIVTMQCDYDDIIDVLCWDNNCKRDYFQKYLLNQAREPALQDGYTLSSGTPQFTLQVTNENGEEVDLDQDKQSDNGTDSDSDSD